MEYQKFLRQTLFLPLGRALRFPEIQHASPLINGGNFLYYWMYAYHKQKQGTKTKVQQQKSIHMWFDEFPWLSKYSVQPTLFHRVLSDWKGTSPDVLGRDFTQKQLREFSIDLLQSSPRFMNKVKRYQSWLGEDTCLINIRRGDYYLHKHLIDQYGLNNEKYIKNALKRVPEKYTRFCIVSDDISWCQEYIEPLIQGEVFYNHDRHDLFDDLALLTAAPALILANSTFSFWGGHLGDSLHPERFVLAPPYHFKNPDGSYNRERFDDSWIIVEFDE
ncbi:alpha-1,2-fucosyltransferase [Rothia nasimurium]|uniref:alpha-1,2-fucosyltransferase n=1 Tax=Rothia nasimurium TaxID=85336 RepID=UPI001EFFB26A|nr:alpha-1,2-fucosyltransferase [Rothia nasimurium]